MPHPNFDYNLPRRRDLSPSTTTASYVDHDPYDRYAHPPDTRAVALQPCANGKGASHRAPRDSRAVQPYTNGSTRRPRDSGALQPYDGYISDTPPRRAVRRRRSDSYLSPSRSPPSRAASKPSRRDQGVDWFKDHGAELLGAAAGGLAGRKKGSEDPFTTASGAAVGAISGKVLDKQYRKWNDKREDKKVGRDVRDRSRNGARRQRVSREGSDEGSFDGYYSRGRNGYGYALEPRYSRSLDRGRGRSVGRDRSPQTFREVASKLRRSLSRKRVER